MNIMYRIYVKYNFNNIAVNKFLLSHSHSYFINLILLSRKNDDS